MANISLAEFFRILEINNPGFLMETKVELKDDLKTHPITLVVLLIQPDQTVIAKATNIDITEKAIENIKRKDFSLQEVLEMGAPRRITIHVFMNDDMQNREVLSL